METRLNKITITHWPHIGIILLLGTSPAVGAEEIRESLFLRKPVLDFLFPTRNEDSPPRTSCVSVSTTSPHSDKVDPDYTIPYQVPEPQLECNSSPPPWRFPHDEQPDLPVQTNANQPLPIRVESNGKSAEFDFDDPPKTIHQLTPTLSFGTKYELEYKLKKNFDLATTVNDNKETLSPEAGIAFSYNPINWASAFVEFKISRDFFINRLAVATEPELKLSINRAYITLKDVVDKLTVQLGRQRFKDPREWWYDEDLDAIRLFYSYYNFGLEFSVSREELVGDDLLNEDNQDEINNYMLVGHYNFDQDTQVNAYVLFQNDHSHGRNRFIHLGIQSIGKITTQLAYWLDSATLLGNNQEKDLRGFAFDLGATYALNNSFKPSLSLGVAFGTGDRDKEDNTDKTFRQTGFGDNNGKFSGVTRFKYYGEVLDPELSNLWILTADIGFKPSKKSSVDFVYHYYRQHKLDDQIRGDIDGNPDEKHKEIGSELDFVVGFREIKNLKVEFVTGIFFPGKALSNTSDKALFGKLQLAYRY